MRPKGREKALARTLREEGVPMKQIAARLGVSPGSVHLWTKDIALTPQQKERIRAANRPAVLARAAAWREHNRKLRLSYQERGRTRARLGDPLHQAGCMLYWAEGAKARNVCKLANSDLHLIRLFVRFLRESMEVEPARVAVSLNVYLGNARGIGEIEEYWLGPLGLPRSCLRKHTFNHMPTSSSGRKKDKLPYGVCTIRVLRSTELVHHIYGAIQEYAGFDEPRWLDCNRWTSGDQAQVKG